MRPEGLWTGGTRQSASLLLAECLLCARHWTREELLGGHEEEGHEVWV